MQGSFLKFAVFWPLAFAMSASVQQSQSGQIGSQIVKLVDFEGKSFGDLKIRLGDEDHISKTVFNLMPFLRNQFQCHGQSSPNDKFSEHQKQLAAHGSIKQNYHFDHRLYQGLSGAECLNMFRSINTQMPQPYFHEVCESLTQEAILKDLRLEAPFDTCLMIHTVSVGEGANTPLQKGVVFYRHTVTPTGSKFDLFVAVGSQECSVDPFRHDILVGGGVGVAATGVVASVSFLPALLLVPVGVLSSLLGIRGWRCDAAMAEKDMLDEYLITESDACQQLLSGLMRQE